MIRLLKFISDSFIWIGLCAGGSYVYTCTLMKMPINWVTLLLISSATTALYSFLKILKKSSGKYKILTGLSSLTAIASLFYSDFNTGYLILIPAGIVGIGYGYIPLYKKNLRSIPFVKVFIIALVWVWVTTVFPIYINWKILHVDEQMFRKTTNEKCPLTPTRFSAELATVSSAELRDSRRNSRSVF